MKNIPKTRDLAILWSHNERKHPKWLDTVMQCCRKGFVWWDVGWSLIPRSPLTGYIWSTIEKQATHRASIERIECQPSNKLAEEVKETWRECNFHVNPNSPLLLYMENPNNRCTLLKLTSLERLLHPRKLQDFILAKEGRPIKQAPQSVAIVLDPHLM